MRRAHQEISAHLDAVFSSTEGCLYVTDLTGGADSRAVLSFFLERGEVDRVAARCLGAYPNPDANVAGYLMEKYGLARARFPVIQEPVEAQLREAAFLGGGASQANVSVAPVAFTDLVHFQGTFGGGLAGTVVDHVSFLKSRGPYSFAKHAELILQRRRHIGPASLVSDAAGDEAQHRFCRYLGELTETGVCEDELSAEVYLRSRCRSHFGQQDFLRNKTKILPSLLANYWLVEARRCLPAAQYTKKKIILDLMLLNGAAELAFAPMANWKWADAVVDSEHAEMLAAMRAIDFGSENLSSFDERLYHPVRVADPRGPLRSVIERRRTDAPKHLLHAGNLAVFQGFCQLFAQDYDKTHEMWSYWHRDRIIDYAKRDVSDFRQDGIDIEALGLFCASAIWLTGLEVVPALQKKRQMP